MYRKHAIFAFAAAASLLIAAGAGAQQYTYYSNLGDYRTFNSAAAYAQDMSARTQALGAENVVGVIPDTLTDLYRNCAFAALGAGNSIRFGRRSSGYHAMHFAFINDDFGISNYYISPFEMNEAAAAFSAGGGWRCAVSSQWTAGHLNDPRVEAYQYGVGSVDFRRETTYRDQIGDDQYLRLDIALAGDAGGLKAGIRAGGSSRYVTDQEQYRNIAEDFSADIYVDEAVSIFERRRTELRRHIQRSSIRYVEMGLIGSNSDLALRGSWQSDFGDYRYDDSSVFEDYRPDGDELRQYEFQSEDWDYRGKGDTYRLSLTGRHVTEGNLVLYAGGAIETGDYETRWKRDEENYRWYMNVESGTSSQRYDGTGDFRRTEGFLRAGRAFEPHERLTLYISGSAAVSLISSEEMGPMLERIRSSAGGISSSADRPGVMEIDMETIISSLVLPVSAEIRPASFLRIYCSLIAGFRYAQTELDSAVPFSRGYDPDRPGIYRAERKKEDLEEIFDMDAGFSIEYGERLFLDFRTGGDLTPDKIDSYVLDLRYLF